MLSLPEAQEEVLHKIRLLGPEKVALVQARGRVLAENVVADRDNPPYDNSAMDGYAVRFEDVRAASRDAPAALEIIEEIAAGSIGRRALGPGQASRIMTGAPLPERADTVVPIEDARSTSTRVKILVAGEKGDHVRPRGDDIEAGAVVLTAGTCCDVGEIGLLAALQRSSIAVRKRPTVAILSTGDELVDIDDPLPPGKIVNSNSYALAELCHAHGAVPLIYPIIRDSKAEIRRAIEDVSHADFILSSGGVSVGDYDFVKEVLEEMDARFLFWRVAMKPGKPLLFCTLGDRPYFGLPGNPVSSIMSFLQFVRPAIRKASGFPADDLLLPQSAGVAGNRMVNGGDRPNYLRAHLELVDGQLRATTRPGQGSHMLTSMLGANGVVLLDAGQVIEEGDAVELQIIPPFYT